MSEEIKPTVPKEGDLLKQFLSKHLHPNHGPVKEPAEVSVATEEPKEPEEIEVATQEPVKPTEKVVRRRKPEPVDPQAIAEEAARLATEKITQQTVKPEPVNELVIPDEYKDRYEVIKYMAKRDKKHAELPALYEKFIKAEAKYISDWQSQNSGRPFDATDDEHNHFYEANLPKYSEHDFRKAEIAMVASEDVNAKSKELEEKINKIDQERAIAALGRDIATARTSLITETAAALSEELAPKFATREGFTEVESQDPLLADVVARSAGAVAPLLDATIQIFRSNGVVKFNEKNPAHMEIAALAEDLEASMAKVPATDRIDANGRRFATREQWEKLPDSEKSRYWFIGESELIYAIIEQARATATRFYNDEKAKIERYTKRHGKPPESQAPAPAAPSAPTRTVSPSGGGDKVVTTKPGKPGAVKSFADVLGRSMFQGKS